MKLFQKSFTYSFEDEKRRGDSTHVILGSISFALLNQAGLEPPHNQIHDVDCAQIQFVHKKKEAAGTDLQLLHFSAGVFVA